MGAITSGVAEVGVAILGYGTVGKGVARAIRDNGAHIENKTGFKLRLLHVLDLLDFPDSPEAGILTHDIRDVVNDAEVSVVVETMGGLKAAFEYTKEAFSKKKHVVTSNKELVAEYGPELLEAAGANGVHYRFDASVGGGIPVITPIAECLAVSRIYEITGILNGTTNYMLTYMRENGAEFSETLAMAQREGYTEQNPAADIEGTDACRKLAILSSLIWDKFLDWKRIHTEGIAKVKPEDIANAADLGRVIKLAAGARMLDGGAVEAYVSPVMLDRRNALAHVEGVNNAIMTSCDLNGDVMLYGMGAGMLPTGGAVVSDIIKVAATLCAGIPCTGDVNTGRRCREPRWDRDDALETADFNSYKRNFYARVETDRPDAVRNAIFREFPEARLLPVNPCFAGDDNAARSCAFTVQKLAEGNFAEGCANIIKSVAGTAVGFIARLL